MPAPKRFAPPRPFDTRLKKTMERLDLPDLRVVVLPEYPGGTWKWDAVALSPAVDRDVPRWKIKQAMAGLMLEHLWDEQSRVGGLFAYTPEEYAGDAAGPADPPPADDRPADAD